MEVSLYLFLFLICTNHIPNLNASPPEGLTLDLVQVLFRHGDRSSDYWEFYEKDPLKNEYQPSIFSPFGVLTYNGKLRAYILGKVLRKQYGHFLKDFYSPEETYARSTFLDRTRMSTEYVIRGMYPESALIDKNSLNIVQLGIFSDLLFFRALYPICRSEFTKLKHIVKEKLAIYDNEIKQIQELTGLRYETIARLNYLFESRESSEIPIPDWCTDDIKNVLKKVYEIEKDVECYNDEMKKMSSGLMINEFINNVKSNNNKIYLYGGHDINLAHLQRTLGIKEYLGFPNYSSAIIFEKYRDSNGQQYVKIVTYDGVTEILKDAKLKDCDVLCPMENFINLLKPVISDK